jgi:hypothetical protein
VGLAARLVHHPKQVAECDALAQLLEKTTHNEQEGESFMLILEVIRSNPEHLEARLPNIFNDDTHQKWVNLVLQEVFTLDSEVDLVAELKSAIYQCTECWFKSELENLAKNGLPDHTALAWYQLCLNEMKNLKQLRSNPL